MSDSEVLESAETEVRSMALVRSIGHITSTDNQKREKNILISVPIRYMSPTEELARGSFEELRQSPVVVKFSSTSESPNEPNLEFFSSDGIHQGTQMEMTPRSLVPSLPSIIHIPILHRSTPTHIPDQQDHTSAVRPRHGRILPSDTYTGNAIRHSSYGKTKGIKLMTVVHNIRAMIPTKSIEDEAPAVATSPPVLSRSDLPQHTHSIQTEDDQLLPPLLTSALLNTHDLAPCKRKTSTETGNYETVRSVPVLLKKQHFTAASNRTSTYSTSTPKLANTATLMTSVLADAAKTASTRTVSPVIDGSVKTPTASRGDRSITIAPLVVDVNTQRTFAIKSPPSDSKAPTSIPFALPLPAGHYKFSHAVCNGIKGTVFIQSNANSSAIPMTGPDTGVFIPIVFDQSGNNIYVPSTTKLEYPSATLSNINSNASDRLSTFTTSSSGRSISTVNPVFAPGTDKAKLANTLSSASTFQSHQIISANYSDTSKSQTGLDAPGIVTAKFDSTAFRHLLPQTTIYNNSIKYVPVSFGVTQPSKMISLPVDKSRMQCSTYQSNVPQYTAYVSPINICSTQTKTTTVPPSDSLPPYYNQSDKSNITIRYPLLTQSSVLSSAVSTTLCPGTNSQISSSGACLPSYSKDIQQLPVCSVDKRNETEAMAMAENMPQPGFSTETNPLSIRIDSVFSLSAPDGHCRDTTFKRKSQLRTCHKSCYIVLDKISFSLNKHNSVNTRNIRRLSGRRNCNNVCRATALMRKCRLKSLPHRSLLVHSPEKEVKLENIEVNIQPRMVSLLKDEASAKIELDACASMKESKKEKDKIDTLTTETTTVATGHSSNLTTARSSVFAKGNTSRKFFLLHVDNKKIVIPVENNQIIPRAFILDSKSDEGITSQDGVKQMAKCISQQSNIGTLNLQMSTKSQTKSMTFSLCSSDASKEPHSSSEDDAGKLQSQKESLDVIRLGKSQIEEQPLGNVSNIKCEPPDSKYDQSIFEMSSDNSIVEGSCPREIQIKMEPIYPDYEQSTSQQTTGSKRHKERNAGVHITSKAARLEDTSLTKESESIEKTGQSRNPLLLSVKQDTPAVDCEPDMSAKAETRESSADRINRLKATLKEQNKALEQIRQERRQLPEDWDEIMPGT